MQDKKNILARRFDRLFKSRPFFLSLSFSRRRVKREFRLAVCFRYAASRWMRRSTMRIDARHPALQVYKHLFCPSFRRRKVIFAWIAHRDRLLSRSCRVSLVKRMEDEGYLSIYLSIRVVFLIRNDIAAI